MFWKLGKGEAALEAFNKFEDFGCTPNADTHYLTIESLFSRSLFDDAWSVCEKLLQSGNLPSNEKIGISLACAKEVEPKMPIWIGEAENAKNLLNKMTESGPPPGNAAFTSVISALSKAGDMEDAIALKNLMASRGLRPDMLIQSLCLKALDWQTAEVLVEEMKQEGLYLNGITRGLIKAVKDLESAAVKHRSLFQSFQSE
ncbi:hypothetical protein H6P81_019426 [Aristolochia fimbriata]|uniref:Pentatricopeptide repeat-containing protein n=1 Tax=Aristolochia fimbriata TaxID=158543 RepID=A0AAV7DUK4_ARIFI|nr:hypothetical protein H6P81_019426 [Aristolochia fimbriata]